MYTMSTTDISHIVVHLIYLAAPVFVARRALWKIPLSSPSKSQRLRPRRLTDLGNGKIIDLNGGVFSNNPS